MIRSLWNGAPRSRAAALSVLLALPACLSGGCTDGPGYVQTADASVLEPPDSDQDVPPANNWDVVENRGSTGSETDSDASITSSTEFEYFVDERGCITERDLTDGAELVSYPQSWAGWRSGPDPATSLCANDAAAGAHVRKDESVCMWFEAIPGPPPSCVELPARAIEVVRLNEGTTSVACDLSEGCPTIVSGYRFVDTDSGPRYACRQQMSIVDVLPVGEDLFAILGVGELLMFDRGSESAVQILPSHLVYDARVLPASTDLLVQYRSPMAKYADQRRFALHHYVSRVSAGGEVLWTQAFGRVGVMPAVSQDGEALYVVTTPSFMNALNHGEHVPLNLIVLDSRTGAVQSCTRLAEALSRGSRRLNSTRLSPQVAGDGVWVAAQTETAVRLVRGSLTGEILQDVAPVSSAGSHPFRGVGFSNGSFWSFGDAPVGVDGLSVARGPLSLTGTFDESVTALPTPVLVPGGLLFFSDGIRAPILLGASEFWASDVSNARQLVSVQPPAPDSSIALADGCLMTSFLGPGGWFSGVVDAESLRPLWSIDVGERSNLTAVGTDQFALFSGNRVWFGSDVHGGPADTERPSMRGDARNVDTPSETANFLRAPQSRRWR